MGAERHAKLFRNGRNQAVRIPREFELPGDEVVMRKEGNRLIIEPPPQRESVAEMLDRWRLEGPLSPGEELPEIEDLPPEPFEL
jgi:antitoxin VapB